MTKQTIEGIAVLTMLTAVIFFGLAAVAVLVATLLKSQIVITVSSTVAKVAIVTLLSGAALKIVTERVNR